MSRLATNFHEIAEQFRVFSQDRDRQRHTLAANAMRAAIKKMRSLRWYADFPLEPTGRVIPATPGGSFRSQKPNM
jgi:hypothetical protein